MGITAGVTATKSCLPTWFDLFDQKIRDILPALQFLCAIMREPWRMEQCSRGRVFPSARPAWTHEPRNLDTNVDRAVDWLRVEFQLPETYRWAVECIARVTMPGMYDNASRLLDTHQYVAEVCRKQQDWGEARNREWQHRVWLAEVLRLAATLDRYTQELERIQEVMRCICYADEVAGEELVFKKLAGQVSHRYVRGVRLLRGEEPELLFP